MNNVTADYICEPYMLKKRMQTSLLDNFLLLAFRDLDCSTINNAFVSICDHLIHAFIELSVNFFKKGQFVRLCLYLYKMLGMKIVYPHYVF